MLELLAAIQNLLFFVLHVNQAGCFPKVLSAAEERKCLELMSEGDDQARQKLIEHNLRLVVHIAKKYFSSDVEQDDIISIGTIGLIKAVSSFDGSKGTRFATYAARCIDKSILSLRLNIRSMSEN